MKQAAILILVSFLYWACDSENIAKPRPRQYPKINFPETNRISFSTDTCPFSMEVPNYVDVVMKPQRDDDGQTHPCWFDIDIPQLGAIIHCSYYAIDAVNSFEKLREDAYVMASKHNVKASYRDEVAVETQQGSKGLFFKIEGPVATPYQFYLSDEVDHFLRGSLYFKQKVDIDSVAPVIDFLREDMNEMVGSIIWHDHKK